MANYGPYPSDFTLFTVRALLAAERRLQIVLRRIRHSSGEAHPSWNWADGFFTQNNTDFMSREDFQAAYEKAIAAAGVDYLIPWRVHQAIWCARHAAKLPGDFIELGTGRGFVMAAVLHSLANESLANRRVFLCDVFQLPSRSGQGLEAFAGVYADGPEAVANFFSQWSSVELVVGDVRETVAHLPSSSIAFAHVDLNDPATEVAVLSQLWPRFVDGALILLDDYANLGMESSYAAANEFFRSVEHEVLTTAAGQGIVVVKK